MIRTLLAGLLLFTSACSPRIASPDMESRWERIQHFDAPGVVSITTGWGRSHLCTGVLVEKDVVLTAAHCLGFPAADLTVTYGCNDVDSAYCKTIEVADTAMHPEYHKRFASAHDLGIVITAEPLEEIEVAKIDYRTTEPLMSVMAAGFGQRYGGSGVLYGAIVRVKKNYEYEFVAGKEGWNDPNPGDSGGPLYSKEMGVIGILSRSIMIDDSRSGYAIYTRPGKYDWVDAISHARAHGCEPLDVLQMHKHAFIMPDECVR